MSPARARACARLVAIASLIAAAPACGGDAGHLDSGAREAGLDASDDLDAAARGDAALDGAFDDGALDASSWGTCSASGVMGVCVDLASCEGVSTPGLCPGPAAIQCCTPHADGGPPDGSGDAGACDPTAMPMPNAGLAEEPGEGGCPAGMVPIDAASGCIDRFEASLEEVLADGSTASWSPYFNPGTRRVRAVSLRGAVPQAYISGVQAGNACAEAGKRLCTDGEWLRACQGSAGSTYPYGDTHVLDRCNETRPEGHPAVEYFGTSAPWIWSELHHPCIDQLPDSLARTGEYALCETESGAFDMSGNLHEWTADPAGTFRGGFYFDATINGPGCLYATTAHDSGHWDYSTGFRCCADR